MIKLNKLKGKIVEKKHAYKECAKALNISTTTFSNKMNGKSEFHIGEIKELSIFLKLTLEEKMDIFLT